eukprot:jgi/Tetstr1/462995/TSEL_007934.t1
MTSKSVESRTYVLTRAFSAEAVDAGVASFAKSSAAAEAIATATTLVVKADAARAATIIGAEMEERIISDLRPETAMAATNLREPIRAREEPKKPDRKLCMMCGKDAGSTTEECGKLRKFVASLKVRDSNKPNTPQLNGYAQVVGGEEGKVEGLAAASQVRPPRRSTEAQR